MCFSDDAVGAQDFYGKSESKEPAEESTESTSFTLEDPFEAFTAEDIWEGDPQQKIQEADVVCGRGKIAFNHRK